MISAIATFGEKSVSDYLFPIFPNRRFGKMGNK